MIWLRSRPDTFYQLRQAALFNSFYLLFLHRCGWKTRWAVACVLRRQVLVHCLVFKNLRVLGWGPHGLGFLAWDAVATFKRITRFAIFLDFKVEMLYRRSFVLRAKQWIKVTFKSTHGLLELLACFGRLLFLRWRVYLVLLSLNLREYSVLKVIICTDFLQV
jgi:hypothetical protein